MLEFCRRLREKGLTSIADGHANYTFQYLGSVEVGESRGMQVCEEALKTLRTNRRRPTKGVLYVSGDGLRVVDSENKVRQVNHPKKAKYWNT